jgi:hypothetical protein
VSRCSNVKPKLLDYLVGNGLMLPGFADTAAFDAALVNLGFGPQLRPQQVRPRAARTGCFSVDYPFVENPPGTKWLESASRDLKPLDRLA